MDGIRIILLGIGILILIINFFINSGNLIKIVSYCFQTNSIGEYWSLFFKSSVNGRAIISSIIGFVLALVFFVLITPFILIRKTIYGKKITKLLEDGLLFQYQDLNLEEDNLFYISNLNQVTGLRLENVKVTGKIRIDALIIISEIEKACKDQGKDFGYTVMEKIKLNNGEEAIVPVVLSIEGKRIPFYFIFNETHKKQFTRIKSTLYNEGYKNIVYFSTLRM